MTVSKELGRKISVYGFFCSAIFRLLSGICGAIYIGEFFSTFWPFLTGVFGDLSFISLLISLLGFVVVYLNGHGKMEYTAVLSMALSLLFMVAGSNSSSVAWDILSGLCACGYIGVMALNAKESGRGTGVLVAFACTAFYMVLGSWLMDLIFIDGLRWYGFGVFAASFLSAACYAFIAAYIRGIFNGTRSEGPSQDDTINMD